MDIQVYKLIHFAGIFMLFVSLGGLTLHAINGGDKASNTGRKLVAISHGVSLLLVLLGGFGALAKIPNAMANGVPIWIWIKLVLWLVLGGLLVVPYKLPKLARPLWLLLPVVGLAAAAVAIYKPFL